MSRSKFTKIDDEKTQEIKQRLINRKFQILEQLEEEKLTHYFDKLNLKTGDIILFKSHTGFLSKFINFWTKSEYVHIGIVIKDVVNFLNLDQNRNFKYDIKNDDNEYGLLECGYEPYADMDQHNLKYGVQITNLYKKIKEYKGKAFLRKLNIIGNPTLNNKKLELDIFNIYELVKNKPYDLNILDLYNLNLDYIMTKITKNQKINEKTNLISQHTSSINQDTPIIKVVFNWFEHDKQKMDKFICSSLVAFIFTKLGFMDKKTEWTEVVPGYFSSLNNNLKFKQFVLLENEKEIIF